MQLAIPSQNTKVFHMFIQYSQMFANIETQLKSLQWMFGWCLLRQLWVKKTFLFGWVLVPTLCYDLTCTFRTSNNLQWVPQLFERLEFFPVNTSFKIECHGNKMHQIDQNMILSRGQELKLSLLWRTTISGQHPLFYRWEIVGEPPLPLKYNGSRGSQFSLVEPISKITDADLR